MKRQSKISVVSVGKLKIINARVSSRPLSWYDLPNNPPRQAAVESNEKSVNLSNTKMAIGKIAK